MSPSRISKKSEAVIQSIIELPDTTEGIITLDKDGTVFCTHASIRTSIAYFLSQKIGLNLPKPVGGVTILKPKSPQDLIRAQLEWVDNLINEVLDDSAFKNRYVKMVLSKRIHFVLKKIDLGLYQSALDNLEEHIIIKINGCAEVDIPDENDWIITCEGQNQIYPIIMDAIEGLRNMN